jgi:hypothetical protein
MGNVRLVDQRAFGSLMRSESHTRRALSARAFGLSLGAAVHERKRHHDAPAQGATRAQAPLTEFDTAFGS